MTYFNSIILKLSNKENVLGENELLSRNGKIGQYICLSLKLIGEKVLINFNNFLNVTVEKYLIETSFSGD